MKPYSRPAGIAAAIGIMVALATALSLRSTHAESTPPDAHAASHAAEPTPGMMQHHGADMMQMHGQSAASMPGAVPTLPGQDAFGAIQEIVRMLEADPATDWATIDLEALRQHLIDMNQVTLNADVAARPVDGGVALRVTGSGRTLAAIQRMVPAHAREIDGVDGWTATSSPLSNGVLLTVTATDAKQVMHIRGLGFIGILVRGAHHQPHHLAIAKGEMSHSH